VWEQRGRKKIMFLWSPCFDEGNDELAKRCRFKKKKSDDSQDPKYRVAQKSVNLKHSLMLTEMFRFKPASQFAESDHSAVSSALSIADFISNNFCKLITNKVISNAFYSTFY
jgi:hypothetical protein